MLDRIHSNNLDIVNQGQGLEKILSSEDSRALLKNEYKNYLIDESQISDFALSKYQKELDIERFGDIVKEMSQKEADNMVLTNIFEGKFNFDDSEILNSILNNETFLNDIFD